MAKKHESLRWSFQYLKDLGVVYQHMWMDQVSGWNGILNKAESGKYTAGEWIADVVGLSERWFRDVWLLGFPFRRWVQQGEQIPSLAFVIDDPAESAPPQEVPLPVGVSPEKTIAVEPKGIAPKTNQPLIDKHIDCKITDDGTHLRVTLQNLRQPGIDSGLYRCLLCGKDGNKWVPLATLEVLRL